MADGAPGTTRERESGETAVPATRPEPSRGWLALAGAIAGAAGLAVSQGVSTALGADDSPLSAVAAAVRDLTPGHLAVRLVHLVGHLDKPLLVGGTTLVLLGICAYAATWARRAPIVPDLTFLVLAALGVAAVLRLPESPMAPVVAVAAGLLTWLISFRVLTGPILVRRGADFSRRGFLLRAGSVVVVVGVLSVAGRAISSGRRRVEDARRALKLPVSRGTAPPGSTLGVRGIEPWRTPNKDFYVIDTTISPPSVSPAEWELRIHGMVEKEVRITWPELIARPLTEAWITLCCVSNEVGGDLIGNAFWAGVPIRDLLAEARPLAGADAVKQTSKDGWNCGTPLSALTDPNREAMLAVAMNGEPLPVHHGFPVRMVVPGLYGFVSATKWVVDLEVTTLDEVHAYWTQRGWSPKGPVKTQSRIDVPGNGDTVKAGTVRVGGSAWAQHTGIEKVEFQLDGGPWQEAELGRVPDLDTWVQWAGAVDVEAGEHRLYVRATDRSGYTQTAAKADVIPDGATGWDTHPFTAQ
jgi:DMSO/TMAO reductase YedYZ molybdopterin-dependent catalytic subunit